MSKLPPRKRNRDEEVISLRNFAREQGDLAQSCMNAKFKTDEENRELKARVEILTNKVLFMKAAIKSLIETCNFMGKIDG